MEMHKIPWFQTTKQILRRSPVFLRKNNSFPPGIASKKKIGVACSKVAADMWVSLGFHKWGHLKMNGLYGKSHIRMDDFGGTTMLGNLHVECTPTKNNLDSGEAVFQTWWG